MSNKFSDKELVDGMLNNNKAIIEYFFFEKCTPMFRHLKYHVYFLEDMNGLINEFFLYLQANNWRKLRQFDHRITLMYWISIIAVRFFAKNRLQARSMNLLTICYLKKGQNMARNGFIKVLRQKICLAN